MPPREPIDSATDEARRALRAVALFSRDVRARAACRAEAQPDAPPAEGRLAIAHVEVLGDDVGEAALHRVTEAIGAQLRARDMTVGLGARELLCIMPGLRLDDVRRRFAAVERSLARDPRAPAIRTGFAMVAAGDVGGLLGGAA